jgi:hypothetical protein
LHVNDIREIWKFVHYISSEVPETRPTENEMMDNINEIRAEVKKISERFLD